MHVEGAADAPQQHHRQPAAQVFAELLETAEHGEDTYWVHNYDATESGQFTLVAAKDGDVQMTHSGTLPAEDVDSEREDLKH